jgi:drug/metabolite transporter (DMT)-like permease
MISQRQNLLGILCLCLGAMVFSAQDSVVKAISGGNAVTLAIVLRTVVAFPILAIMVAFAGGIHQLDSPHKKFLIGRGILLLFSYTLYFMALAALPLAQAIALFFLAPVIVTLLSGPMLDEKVSPLAWAAVGIGLIGIVFILRLDTLVWQNGVSLFQLETLLSFISAITYAFAVVLTRKNRENMPASVMTFYQNAVYLIGALLLLLVLIIFDVQQPDHPSFAFLLRGWTVPSWQDMGLMALCGVIAAAGSTLLTQAYRMGEANIVTPFEYTGMIWATLLGFLFFKEVPAVTTLIGMALIAGAGGLALRAGKSG